MGMEDLQRLKEKAEGAPRATPDMPDRTRRRSNRPLFADTHVRFTNYFRKDVAARIERLRAEGRLDRSLTEILNEAVRKYLDTYY